MTPTATTANKKPRTIRIIFLIISPKPTLSASGVYSSPQYIPSWLRPRVTNRGFGIWGFPLHSKRVSGLRVGLSVPKWGRSGQSVLIWQRYWQRENVYDKAVKETKVVPMSCAYLNNRLREQVSEVGRGSWRGKVLDAVGSINGSALRPWQRTA